MWRVRVVIVAVEAIIITYYEYVCSLSYPSCNANALYYIFICDLSGWSTFFNIIIIYYYYYYYYRLLYAGYLYLYS